MKILYVEPFSGVAGDMFLSALCELADAFDTIEALPGKLHLPDGKVEIAEVEKNGIVCRQVTVLDLNPEKPRHHAHDHGRKEDHHHGHAHNHPHGRHLSDILELIDRGHIPSGAKKIAVEIFQIIGRAESTVHNIPVEKIHFHEISGVDSIIDIVGCALLLDRLQIERTYSDPICTGFGMVKTQHGLLPIPAPATALLLQEMPVYKGEEEGERVTPTGAAILRYLDPSFSTPSLQLRKTAYGPGQKNFSRPNVVRLSLGSEVRAAPPSSLYVIQTDLDDCSPELLGEDFRKGLTEAGAVDFTLAPVSMKKGRPGLKLSSLATEENRQAVCHYILENTTTIGVRYFPVQREKLPRQTVTMETAHGPIRAKRVTTPSGKSRIKAEYDDLLKTSKEKNIPLIQLKQEIEGNNP